MIIYFTGTGNSRYCAQQLSRTLGDELMDSFHFIRDGIAAELLSDRPWVFVCPTYAWRLPRIFSDFIRSGYFSGCRNAYFVMTCGDDIGSAAHRNRALSLEKGFNYMGTLRIVMPENYVAMFPVPEREESRLIVHRAQPALELACQCIRGGSPFPEPRRGALAPLKSGMVNSAFYRFIVHDRAFTVSGACTACGKCESLCPLGNITLTGGKPVWNGKCTHCMACICSCPAGAIEYGKRSLGKPRYLCPEDAE